MQQVKHEGKTSTDTYKNFMILNVILFFTPRLEQGGLEVDAYFKENFIRIRGKIGINSRHEQV